MLNPSNDRLDYGQLLTPPVDYSLDFAVGTTYSLDLEALVEVCVALGLSAEIGSELMNNPVCLLEALRNTGKRVALFCEAGQISLPTKVTPLYILLENIVFPVTTTRFRGIKTKGKQYPSFHPKFWLLRYKNKEDNYLYQFIVLSRNLTFDRSWDIAFSMEGEKGETIVIDESGKIKNQPLCDFLNYLTNFTRSDRNGRAKAKLIRSLISELPYVAFRPEENIGKVRDYDFVPNGVKREDGSVYLFDEWFPEKARFNEILIMSPFLSADIVRSFNEKIKVSVAGDTLNENAAEVEMVDHANSMLFTRKEALADIQQKDVSNFKIFVMRDDVIDGEAEISDEANQIPKKQDIHAKMYMVRKGSDVYLYMGSLNASHNAVYANVEFMIRLKFYRRNLDLEKLAQDLFCGKQDNSNNPFQEITLQNVTIDSDVNQDNNLDLVVKNIIRNGELKAEVEEINGQYSVIIHCDETANGGFHVQIRPLLIQRVTEWKELKTEVVFAGLSIAQLSEFYVLSVSCSDKPIERVVFIHTEGIPTDREKSAVASVITNQDSFYRYISFLLSEDKVLSLLEDNFEKEDAIIAANRRHDHAPALYESLLQAAATDPEKFRNIENFMNTISEDGVIPDSFRKLYETFMKVVKLNG